MADVDPEEARQTPSSQRSPVATVQVPGQHCRPVRHDHAHELVLECLRRAFAAHLHRLVPLHVRHAQLGEIPVPIGVQMIDGMQAGWTQSIDKLEELVARSR